MLVATSEQLKPVSPENRQWPALSKEAQSAGLKEAYTLNPRKRYVISPRLLSAEGLVATNAITLPHLVRTEQSENGLEYYYEIPFSSVAWNLVNTQSNSQQQVHFNPELILSDFFDANPQLDAQNLRARKNWAIANGVFVPIFPQ